MASPAPATPHLPPPTHSFLLKTHAAKDWFRVHPFDVTTGKYQPAHFNASGLGNARFSPLFNPATMKAIPTIYAANKERGAIAEIVLHNVPSPSTGYIHDLEADYRNKLHLSRVRTPELDLVNLTSTGLQAVGMAPSHLFDGEEDDYPRTRAWALWIWQNMPRAQGLHWMSKRDNTCEVIVLFGDRIPAGIEDGGHSMPLEHYEDLVIEQLAEMGAAVFPKR